MDIHQLHLRHFFEIDSASITRGHKGKLKKKRINNDLRHHFFSDRIINWWNMCNIGECVQELSAKNVVKR